MSFTVFFPMVLGMFAVLQAALNRRFATNNDLALAVFTNASFLFVAALIFFLMSRFAPDYVPEIFKKKDSPTILFWWIFLPGIFGFTLVAGLPWAISKIGATQAFIGLISAQLMTSILWDYFVEGIQVSTSRIVALLLVVGAAVFNRQ